METKIKLDGIEVIADVTHYIPFQKAKSTSNPNDHGYSSPDEDEEIEGKIISIKIGETVVTISPMPFNCNKLNGIGSELENRNYIKYLEQTISSLSSVLWEASLDSIRDQLEDEVIIYE